MSKLTIIKPEVGKPDATEDVKIVNALTAIENWANGLIDSTNITKEGVETAAIKVLAITTALLAEGSVTESKLSAALQKRLGEAVTVGEWKAILLSSKAEAAPGVQTAESRKEIGSNICRLRGGLKVKAGEEIKLGEDLALVPFPPLDLEAYDCPTSTGVTVQIAIEPSGNVTANEALKAGRVVYFSGITYNLT
jgi:hypothetical protein